MFSFFLHLADQHLPCPSYTNTYTPQSELPLSPFFYTEDRGSQAPSSWQNQSTHIYSFAYITLHTQPPNNNTNTTNISVTENSFQIVWHMIPPSAFPTSLQTIRSPSNLIYSALQVYEWC